VAQIDAADEGDVGGGTTGVTEHDHLHVVRAARPDPHVEHALPAGRLDLLAQLTVLLFAELEAVEVRAPQQASHQHATAGCRAEQVRYPGARRGEPLVGVAAPVGEEQQIAGLEGGDAGQQLREVGRAVDQRPDLVAGRPRRAAAAGVEAGGRVATLRRGEEPVIDTHPGQLPANRPGIRAARPGRPHVVSAAARRAAPSPRPTACPFSPAGGPLLLPTRRAPSPRPMAVAV
jgi:hypothetical protein